MRSYQAGVITFGNEATLEIKLNATYDKEVLEELIRGIQYKDENTNTSGKILHFGEKNNHEGYVLCVSLYAMF